MISDEQFHQILQKQNELKERVRELERELDNCHCEYKSNFKALLIFSAQYQCITPEKLRLVVNQLLGYDIIEGC